MTDALWRLLDTAHAEMRQWRSTSAEATRYPEGFYTALEGMLSRARACSSLDLLDAEVGSIVRYITDSGPLGANFMPSLDRLGEALEKRRRRK